EWYETSDSALRAMEGVVAEGSAANKEVVASPSLHNVWLAGFPENTTVSEIEYAITVTANPSAGGTISGTGSYTSGTAVTLTATPNTGYKFVNWTKDSVEVSTSASIEITVTGDAAYVANFQRNSQDSTGGKRPSSNKGNNTEVVPPVVEENVPCTGDDKCLMHGYSDLDPKVWYHNGIEYCIEKGIMSGYGNGVFKPNADTSRAMLMVMLWNMNGSPIVSDSMDFKDVAEGKWYTEAIRWAKAEGIASGYGNGYFGTDDLITREQVVTMLWNYAKYKGMDVSKAEETSILSYGDAEDVARYAVSAMQWACDSGVVSGKNNADKTGLILDPAGNGTRAQIATMIWNFCEKQ
ncbi:MAG: S-layer homology domain-containing protein, partial [Firmicutes bacterium]|nr:S-layer homology domain-containing protein [Bacillota bacterium]